MTNRFHSRRSGRVEGTHRVVAKSIAVLLMAIWSSSAAGQGTSTPAVDQAPSYLTVGLGKGTMNLAYQLGFSVTAPIGEFTVRLAGVNDLGPSANANDVALLYGLRRIEGTRWHSVGVGPGMAWVTREECVSYSTGEWLSLCNRYKVVERQWAPGFAFQGAVGWRGISLSVIGDLNSIQSFAALTLNLHIGKVR